MRSEIIQQYVAAVLMVMASSAVASPILKTRNVQINKYQRWPNGVVPYVIHSSYSLAVRTTILTAMVEIETNVNLQLNCIRFLPRTVETNYVEIYPGQGCFSAVGMTGRGRQELSITPECEMKGPIMHELLHTLGFLHEQNRPDRDTYINVDLTNVASSKQADFARFTSTEVDTLGTSYDFESIMHYRPYTSALNPALPVITPKFGQAVGLTIGQRIALTATDILRVQRHYQCLEGTSQTNNPFQTEGIFFCNFANDVCGLNSSPSPNVPWTIQYGVSGAGPITGNSNGADPYLVALASGNSGKVARITTPSFIYGPVCLDFYHYQKGPSSYLELVASGSSLFTQTFKSYQNDYQDKWTRSRIELYIPDGLDFMITFVANINEGDVAIDDVFISVGECA